MISRTETCPVEVIVDLPVELVDDVRAVSDSDPDFFGRVIEYALARRIIFQELATASTEKR